MGKRGREGDHGQSSKSKEGEGEMKEESSTGLVFEDPFEVSVYNSHLCYSLLLICFVLQDDYEEEELERDHDDEDDVVLYPPPLYCNFMQLFTICCFYCIVGREWGRGGRRRCGSS